MRKNKITLIVIAVALAAYIFTQVAPAFLTSKKEKSATRSKNKMEQTTSNPPIFEKEGMGWFVTPSQDTLSELELEISETAYETAKGLMDRRMMQDHEGMLFIFDSMEPRSFWMKNTYISLDIIYVKSDGTIDSYYENTTPLSTQSLPSKGEAMYVVEVVAGYMAQNNIDSTTIFKFKRN